jgi:hypothetical protein
MFTLKGFSCLEKKCTAFKAVSLFLSTRPTNTDSSDSSRTLLASFKVLGGFSTKHMVTIGRSFVHKNSRLEAAEAVSIRNDRPCLAARLA